MFSLLACMQVLENNFAHDRLAIDNPQGWVQNWAKLVTAITANSVAASRIIISPLGNPDAHGLRWVSLQHEQLFALHARMAVPPSCISFTVQLLDSARHIKVLPPVA